VKDEKMKIMFMVKRIKWDFLFNTHGAEPYRLKVFENIRMYSV
jgi:hypothetical protein